MAGKCQTGGAQLLRNARIPTRRALHNHAFTLVNKVVLGSEPAFKDVSISTLKIQHFHGSLFLGFPAGPPQGKKAAPSGEATRETAQRGGFPTILWTGQTQNRPPARDTVIS